MQFSTEERRPQSLLFVPQGKDNCTLPRLMAGRPSARADRMKAFGTAPASVNEVGDCSPVNFETSRDTRPKSLDSTDLDLCVALWVVHGADLGFKQEQISSYEYSKAQCGDSILLDEPPFKLEEAVPHSPGEPVSDWLLISDWFVSRILSPCFDEMSYSRMPYIFGETDSSKAASYWLQGNCVAFAQYLLTKLGQEFQAEGIGIIIPSTLPEAYHQPGYPHWAHVAVAVPIRNYGCIILDPAIRLLQPVVLLGEGAECTLDWPDGPRPKSASKLAGNRWTFRLNSKKGIVTVLGPQTGGEKNVRFTYFLRPIFNADQAITVPTNDFNKRISLVRTDTEGTKIGHLSIRLDNQRVEAFVRGEWKEPLKFCDFLADHDDYANAEISLRRWMTPDELGELTACEPDVLYTQICKIVAAHQKSGK